MRRVAGCGRVAGQRRLVAAPGTGPACRLSCPCSVGTLQSGATVPVSGAFTLNSGSLGCLENPEALASWTHSCAASLPAPRPACVPRPLGPTTRRLPGQETGAVLLGVVLAPLGFVFFYNNSKVESEALFIPVSLFRMEKGKLALGLRVPLAVLQDDQATAGSSGEGESRKKGLGE